MTLLREALNVRITGLDPSVQPAERKMLISVASLLEGGGKEWGNILKITEK